MKPFGALIVMLLIGPGVGCALSTGPKDDTGFDAAKDLQALGGCYRNNGEGDDQRYLSAVIWPREGLDHPRIKAIHVAFEKPQSLRITAVGTGEAIKESIFVEGKDFHLASGRIEVKSDAITSFAYPAGNVFIGVGNESRVLGLDKHGNARMQESASFAGTAFLVIPVAGHVRDAFRFSRAPALCEES